MCLIARYLYVPLWVLVLSVLVLPSCDRPGGSQQKERGKAVPVRAYTVIEEEVDNTEEYPAIVVPMSEIALRPRLKGRVSDVYVREGQVVEQGQRLYGIDRPSYKRAYQEAQDRLEKARERQALARRELSRYEQKKEEEAGAGQRAVLARSDLEKAISEVDEAQEQLEEISEDLEHSLVRAPFEGTLGTTKVATGSTVSPERPLNMLISAKLIAVDLVVKAAEIGKLERLLDKEPEDSVFMLSFDNGLLYPYPGKIATIDHTEAPQAGAITARLVFPNPEGQLKPGMRVRVKVSFSGLDAQLLIPQTAVKKIEGNFYVFAIHGNTAERRQVSLGASTHDLVVVRHGLEEGERIVLEIRPGLEDGSRVVITSLPKGPARQSRSQRQQAGR